jgi:hypothetical protein
LPGRGSYYFPRTSPELPAVTDRKLSALVPAKEWIKCRVLEFVEGRYLLEAKSMVDDGLGEVPSFPRRFEVGSSNLMFNCCKELGNMAVKIGGHGQAAILSHPEIELLFSEGLQSDRDRALFGVCLYTAARIAEACSMLTEDVYTSGGRVRASVNIRKAATKGKLATRTIPVIEDLRSLLTAWQPHAGQIYLFPSRHSSHHWRHITSDSAAVILREACKRVGIEGASTHSFRRTALTQMSNAGHPAAGHPAS